MAPKYTLFTRSQDSKLALPNSNALNAAAKALDNISQFKRPDVKLESKGKHTELPKSIPINLNNTPEAKAFKISLTWVSAPSGQDDAHCDNHQYILLSPNLEWLQYYIATIRWVVNNSYIDVFDIKLKTLTDDQKSLEWTFEYRCDRPLNLWKVVLPEQTQVLEQLQDWIRWPNTWFE